jgi:preprotein translocase subunit YajC
MLFTNAYANDDVISIEESEALPPAPSQIQSSWTSVVPMVLIFVVLYFFLIRPQEKRRRQHEELVSGVKKGEEVLTTSGMYGVVTKIFDDGSVEIEIAENIKVKMLKTSIAEITSRKIEVKDKKIKGAIENKDKKDQGKGVKKST